MRTATRHARAAASRRAATILLIMTIATTTSLAAEPAPPGASRAFVSTDPDIATARLLYEAGRFRDADAALNTAADRVAADEFAEILRRARRDYSLTPDRLRVRLAESIPDVTAADVARWIASGDVQHRVIDGQVAIFRREPGHLLRFCQDAMQRRDAAKKPAPPEPAPAWTLHDHLRAVIAAAPASGAPQVLPVRHRITYTLTVSPDRAGAKPGSKLAVWLPFPQVYARQRDVRLIESDPPGAVLADAATDGNPVTGPAQRTVYLERRIDDPSQAQVFRIRFEFTTSAYYPDLKPGVSRPQPSTDVSTYLVERPPHIVFTPALRAKVREIVGDDADPLSRARKIFHWIDENLRWTPEEEYGIIPNLSRHGFVRGKGDCGVAAMLYITLCRIAGVPARWQSGWTTRPVGWNMHDWAEIFVEPWGWLPVDASYGRQKSDDPAIRDFYFGHTDSYRLIVNLDYGRELSPVKRSLRSEPLDFQRGEVELDGKNLYFDDWDYDIAFERDPGP